MPSEIQITMHVASVPDRFDDFVGRLEWYRPKCYPKSRIPKIILGLKLGYIQKEIEAVPQDSVCKSQFFFFTLIIIIIYIILLQ